MILDNGYRDGLLSRSDDDSRRTRGDAPARIGDGVARVVWVDAEGSWAATGYDGQAIGLFDDLPAACAAIGGGFTEAVRRAIEGEQIAAVAAAQRAARVVVPRRFRAPEPEPEPEPSAVMGGGDVVAEPEPVPPLVDLPVVGPRTTIETVAVVPLSSPEIRKNARYWFTGAGWFWATEHGEGGPFGAFDDAVAARDLGVDADGIPW